MSSELLIPPVNQQAQTNGESSISNNPFRKSLDAAATQQPPSSSSTSKPAQSSAVSPLLAQLGTDPSTGVETTLSLFAFTAENEDELTFPANELIVIVEKDHEYNDGWYRGRNAKGEEGLFPASYVLPSGADPKPYLEMQQAPQPLNIGGPDKALDQPAQKGLGISSSGTSDQVEEPRPSSPTKSLARTGSRSSLVTTREQAARGEIQGPHSAASELVSPAERAAASMEPEQEALRIPEPVSDKTLGGRETLGGRDSTEDPDRTITGLERQRTIDTDKDASSLGHQDDEQEPGNNNIRARLAEQARLENEKLEAEKADEEDTDGERKRVTSDASATLGSRPVSSSNRNYSYTSNGGKPNGNQRISGVRMSGVPHGLVYSDESDSEEEGSVVGGLGSPKRGAGRRLGWEEEEEAATRDFSFGRFGAMSGTSKPEENVTRRQSEGQNRLEQIDESRSLAPSIQDDGGLTASNPRDDDLTPQPSRSRLQEPVIPSPPVVQEKSYAAPAPISPVVPVVPVAPVAPVVPEPVVKEDAYFPPVENTPKLRQPAFLSPPEEESPMGTPAIPRAVSQITAPVVTSPPPVQPVLKESAVVSSPPVAPIVAPVPVTQPTLHRNVSDDNGFGSGRATPKDIPRQSESWANVAGNPHGWGVTEVIEWARKRGFDDAVCEKFAEHEITGDILLDLDANLLKELDIPQFGKRVKIANAIAELRRPQSTLSVGNASVRSSQFGGAQGHARGPSMGTLGTGYGSPAVSPSPYPASPTYGYENGPRSAGGAGVQPVIHEDEALQSDELRTPPEQVEPVVSNAQSRPQSQSQPPRSASGTPSSTNYAEWAHSRKSSVAGSLATAPIIEEDESGKRRTGPPSVHQSFTPDAPTQSMLPPGAREGTGSIRSIDSSIPPSPQTPNTKRSSTEQRVFGHKKAKSSMDGSRPPSERMSFFGGTIGRNRKPAPRYPSNASTAAFAVEDQAPATNGPDRQRSLSRLVGGGGGNRLTKSSVGPASAPITNNQRISVGNPVSATAPTTPQRGGNTVASPPGEGSAISKIGKPDYAGYMKKKGERYNTWKNRYFVLKGSHLYYMKSPQEDKAKGHIDLTGYKVLSDPNAGSGFGFQIVHDREKTHYFASNDEKVIKGWMKNLMKATISRDYSAPVVSSCNIPTIPLREAQMMAPRPPSPGERDAAQRAARRDDPNKLTPRDASVLMSLENSPTSPKRNTAQQNLGRGSVRPSSSMLVAPGRPSRDMRRPSDRQGSTASFYPQSDGPETPRGPIAGGVQNPLATPLPIHPETRRELVGTNNASNNSYGQDGDLLAWINARLPRHVYDRADSLAASFRDGKIVTRLIETYCNPESPSAVPADESIFQPVALGEPNLEGLFTMMDKCIDEGVDTVGSSINDIRLGHEEETRKLLTSLRGWIENREA